MTERNNPENLFIIKIYTFEYNVKFSFWVSVFHHFPKNKDRTITFDSFTLKNTQTEPGKYYILFNKTNNSPWIK